MPRNLNVHCTDSTAVTVLFMMVSGGRAGGFLLKSTIISTVLSVLSSRLLRLHQTASSMTSCLLADSSPSWMRPISVVSVVDRVCEQQQAICAALVENRKWCLMTTHTDITTLETVREVLGPLSTFTFSLCGEKGATLSSVIPVM